MNYALMAGYSMTVLALIATPGPVVLLVTGCAADIERDQLSAMPEVDGLAVQAALDGSTVIADAGSFHSASRASHAGAGDEPERSTIAASASASRRGIVGFATIDSACFCRSAPWGATGATAFVAGRHIAQLIEPSNNTPAAAKPCFPPYKT